MVSFILLYITIGLVFYFWNGYRGMPTGDNFILFVLSLLWPLTFALAFIVEVVEKIKVFYKYLEDNWFGG